MLYKKRNIKKMVQIMPQKNNLFNKGKNINNKKKT